MGEGGGFCSFDADPHPRAGHDRLARSAAERDLRGRALGGRQTSQALALCLRSHLSTTVSVSAPLHVGICM